ncbi:hypothetical protein GCM10010266_62760 [Streptomyces griseomycini]|uniref:hypothetical protein n=1 Tax=Streptomyces griseomycini TaxID=66895 RepID=UPI001873D4FB|nr:hypothetical protein [Streptomyces griseomycini]GGQ30944.1 hypothetical protein GCM10010266_62760 [Streptomyces griseomycini]
MTTTEHTELIRRLADDFTALQDAVLARMNGTCAPETAEALEHASLAGPITVTLAHADVLARGAVRRAELSVQPPERLRRLRVHAAGCDGPGHRRRPGTRGSVPATPPAAPGRRTRWS